VTTFVIPVVSGFSRTVISRSSAVGCFNAVAFTLVRFFLWYRGIARCGVARTSICCFAEPLVATAVPLLVVKSAPADPVLVARRRCGARRDSGFGRPVRYT
jgi:drug/metabolite transporter (DMT)-like permease